MRKYKRVGGKTYKRVAGAPALWSTGGHKAKRFSDMELEAKRKRLKKR